MLTDELSERLGNWVSAVRTPDSLRRCRAEARQSRVAHRLQQFHSRGLFTTHPHKVGSIFGLQAVHILQNRTRRARGNRPPGGEKGAVMEQRYRPYAKLGSDCN